MKLKNWIFVSGAILIFASCGENSTTESTTSDSTAGANADNTTVSAKSVDVPPATRTSFETKYPGASNVTWNYYDEPYSAIDWEWTAWPAPDTNDYLVRYNWEGVDYYSWYNDNGDWIGTTGIITDFSGLPAPVSNAVKTNFDGYTIVSVDKEHDKSREAYEIELEKGNDKAKVLIAADGTVLKKKTNVDGVKSKEKADVK